MTPDPECGHGEWCSGTGPECDPVRLIETAGPSLARILFGWDGPMWRYRTPTWGAWQQGEPPTEEENDG